eukprot:2113268-Pleurochrysis_carterae.AAC.2
MPANQLSGRSVTLSSAQCMNAIAVYGPCGCHTTIVCVSCHDPFGSLTEQRREPMASMSHEKKRATRTASQRGPHVPGRRVIDWLARYQIA